MRLTLLHHCSFRTDVLQTGAHLLAAEMQVAAEHRSPPAEGVHLPQEQSANELRPAGGLSPECRLGAVLTRTRQDGFLLSWAFPKPLCSASSSPSPVCVRAEHSSRVRSRTPSVTRWLLCFGKKNCIQFLGFSLSVKQMQNFTRVDWCKREQLYCSLSSSVVWDQRCQIWSWLSVRPQHGNRSIGCCF